jgi:hypothetical protein
MAPDQLELEKHKMQKTQMYLQVVSVLLSSIFLYVIVTGKSRVKTVRNPNDDDYDPDIFEED